MKQEQQKSNVSREIDENLKRAYDDVLKEEIPDKFKTLLAQLRNAEMSSGEDSHDT